MKELINDDIAKIVEEAVNAPSEAELLARQLRGDAMMNLIDIDEKLPKQRYLLKIGDVEFLAVGELASIRGKMKSGKTKGTAILCAAMLGCDAFAPKGTKKKIVILYVDTEQSKNDAQALMKRIHKMSGMSKKRFKKRFHMVYHRECDFDKRLQQIEILAEELKPTLIVIDNVADLLNDFNDITDSRQLIEALTTLAAKHNCAIITIQHENKRAEDTHTQGHLGGYQDKKASLLLQCRKDGDTFIMSCVGARHEEVPEWTFKYDDEGNLVDAMTEHLQQKEQRELEAKQKRLDKKQSLEDGRWQKAYDILMRHGGILHRSQFSSQLEGACGVSRKTISPLITKWIKDGRLKEDQNIITLIDKASD